MNKAVTKELHRVIDLCMEINEKTGHDVMFYYSGHVNRFDIDVYVNGYKGNKDATHISSFKKLTLQNLKSARQKLLKCKEQRV